MKLKNMLISSSMVIGLIIVSFSFLEAKEWSISKISQEINRIESLNMKHKIIKKSSASGDFSINIYKKDGIIRKITTICELDDGSFHIAKHYYSSRGEAIFSSFIDKNEQTKKFYQKDKIWFNNGQVSKFIRDRNFHLNEKITDSDGSQYNITDFIFSIFSESTKKLISPNDVIEKERKDCLIN